MTRLAIIRHGLTEWNELGRLQGCTDIPLNATGREMVSRWKLPPELEDYRLVSSPLKRAVETARILVGEPEIVACLREMSYGDWEGRRLADLRAELGREMVENERRGLDFLPPGGESPRHLQNRLSAWLKEVGEIMVPTLAIAHNGVLRAIYALASGWDMTAKPPTRLLAASAHLFAVDGDGQLRIERLNIPLEDGR